jgi:TonB family protein
MFESRQQGHVPYQRPFDITNLDNGKTITIDSPTPIYGSLVISSTPAKAKISINGVYVGDTPKFISNQIVGKYTVTAEKEGYEKLTKTVEVTEGAEASLSFQLNKSNALIESPADGKTVVLKVKGIEYPMVYVEGGTFMMGAESRYETDEKPIHEVTLSSYRIGKYEVTQDLWEAVMGSNPSEFKDPSRPVEIVSWNDCQEFIRKLNSLTGKNFKLPTEAQWEYAARGGKKSKGYKYSGSNTLDNVGWCQSNSMGETHVVGTKSPNELGIHDMSGNVWEWCSDWEGPYSILAQTNPTGVPNGTRRILRGGCWSNNDGWVSNRFGQFPDYRHIQIGFRLCLDTSDSKTVVNNQPSTQSSVTTPAPVVNVPADAEEPIPFQLVEEKPKFQGGDANQFSKWVNQRLVYPEIARENGVQGRVNLQFTVGKDGSIYNIKVLRGIDPSLDKEAVRVVSMSPKWTPGKQRDRAVPVTYTFPVIFQLN